MNKFLFILGIVTILCACNKPSTNTTDNISNDSTTVAATTTNNDERDYIVAVGDEAPSFTLPLYGSDEPCTLADTKGKVVMLQFTASWCGVCRKEMPQIESKIWQKHKNNPLFVLYAVDREEDDATIKEFIEKTGITYPVLKDTAATAFDKYAVHDSGITRNVIINKEGNIEMLTRLYEEDEFAQMCNLIDSLLNN